MNLLGDDRLRRSLPGALRPWPAILTSTTVLPSTPAAVIAPTASTVSAAPTIPVTPAAAVIAPAEVPPGIAARARISTCGPAARTNRLARQHRAAIPPSSQRKLRRRLRRTHL